MGPFNFNEDNSFDFEIYTIVKGFFSPDLLKTVQKKILNAEYSERTYITPNGNGTHWVTHDPFVKHISTLMNDRPLFQFLENLNSTKDLVTFGGRVYRLDADDKQFLPWHADLDQDKRLAVTINLSPENFDGGELCIREAGVGIVAKIHNFGQGDAVFFKLDPKYSHMVLPVTGPRPKYAYAGFFFGPNLETTGT